MKRSSWLILACAMVVSQVDAGKIRVRLPDTTAVRGSTVTVPVYVDSTLTGAGVTAFQLRIQFSPSVIHVDSVLSAGSLIDGSGSYSFNVAGNYLNIGWAGSTPLAGTGVLLRLRLLAFQTGSSSFYFPDTLANFFNENTGSPGFLIDNGSFQVQAPPSISISPSSVLLAPGEEQQFYGSGGSPPYVWSLTNPAVGSISSAGLFTAGAAGMTRIVAQDTLGYADTSNGEVEVRALLLSAQSVSSYPRTEIFIPIMTSNLDGLGISSGTITLSFSNVILEPAGVDLSGTLLDGYGSFSVDTMTAGKISIAFAGPTSLGGSGILLRFRMRVRPTATYSTSLSFDQAMFNESMPAKTVQGTFSLLSAGVPYVSPNTGSMLAGDSLFFTVSNGVPPYMLSSSDTGVARFTSPGWLRGIQSGVVQVLATDSLGSEGSSGNITIYGARASLPQMSVPRGVIVEIPLELNHLVLTGAAPVSAFSALIQYDTSRLRFRGITTTGTLTDGWGYAIDSSGNRIGLAGATAGGFSTIGTVVLLQIETRSDVSFGATGSLTFQSMTLNEGVPSVTTQNGQLSIVAPPAAPVLYSPGDGSTGAAVNGGLYWYGSSGADKYRVQLSADSMFASSIIHDSTVTGPPRLYGPLSILTKYFWRVSAINGAGESEWSALFSFTTTGVLPAKVMLDSPADSAVVSGGSLQVKWFPSSPDVTTYDAEISTNVSFAGASVDSNLTDTLTVFSGLTPGRYYWRVRAKNAAGFGPYSDIRTFEVVSTGVWESASIPDRFVLLQNHPNPFNPSTTIRYYLPEAGSIRLSVYNALGQHVATLVDGEQSPGWQRATWFATVPSGTYFYRVEVSPLRNGIARTVQTGRMVLLK